MSLSESRSIYSGPIRRSFDVIQSNAKDLAAAVSDLADLVDENHINSAWGIVKRGSFPYSPNVTVGAGAVRNQLTNPLSVTFVKDRVYQVRCVLRAVGVVTDVDPAVIEGNDLVGFVAFCNVSGIDRGGAGLYVQALDNWQGANFVWTFYCPGEVPVGAQTVTIYVTDTRGINQIIYTDPGSNFVIQDIGPVPT